MGQVEQAEAPGCPQPAHLALSSMDHSSENKAANHLPGLLPRHKVGCYSFTSPSSVDHDCDEGCNDAILQSIRIILRFKKKSTQLASHCRHIAICGRFHLSDQHLLIEASHSTFSGLRCTQGRPALAFCHGRVYNVGRPREPS